MAIYNICGQPHSGKTTIANHLKEIIKANDSSRIVFVLDGDELRRLFLDSDFSKEGRIKNIDRAYSIATYLSKQVHTDVIIAAISPFITQREAFKLNHNAIEIYVHTTNVRGRENFHTEYEIPKFNFIDIDTTDVDEITTMNELMQKINEYSIK